MTIQITKFHEGGNKELPPLIFMHPITGRSNCYTKLLKSLDIKQDIWIVESPLYDRQHLETIGTFEQLIELIAEITNKEVSGNKYFFAGWSFGAVIAFEVAKKLADIEVYGKQIEGLFLIDPPIHLVNNMDDHAFLQYFKMIFNDIIRNQPNLRLKFKEDIENSPKDLTKEELINHPEKYIIHHNETTQSIEVTKAAEYYSKMAEQLVNFQQLLSVTARNLQFATEYPGPSGSVKFMMHIKAENNSINHMANTISWNNHTLNFQETTIQNVNHFDIIQNANLIRIIQEQLENKYNRQVSEAPLTDFFAKNQVATSNSSSISATLISSTTFSPQQISKTTSFRQLRHT